MKPLNQLLFSTVHRLVCSAFALAVSFVALPSTLPAQEMQKAHPNTTTAAAIASLKKHSVSNDAEVRECSENLAAGKHSNPIALQMAENHAQSVYIPAQINKSDLRQHLYYPESALRQDKEGLVDVIVYLNADGQIMSINALSDLAASDDFAQAAVYAVKKCRFTPAYRDNNPVNSVVQLPVRFVR